jgi:single-stranded DNA-specific DHH superfamily exonuclease
MLENLAENKEKVNNFLNKIKKSDRIALITHTDLDGIASAKVITKLIRPELIKFLQYEEINKGLIENLKKESINKVIFTDISIDLPDTLKEIEKFSEVLIIDHHQFKEDLTSEKTTFINYQGYCAAYICYELFKENEEIRKLDWLIVLATDADMMFLKNKDWLIQIYKKYGDEFNIENPWNGKIFEILEKLTLAIAYFQEDLSKFYNNLGDDLGNFKELEKAASEVRKEINANIENFDKQKEIIKQGYFYEGNSGFKIDSKFATEISSREKDRIYVIAFKRKECYKISARRQDKKINMAKYLQKATQDFDYKDAGGHIPAAGARISFKDFEEFKKRLKTMDLEDLRIN